MPFHVEISSGFRQRARAFNLDEETVRRTILGPWAADQMIELGDKQWRPRDCKLIILEGPELADTDLAMGRGWSNAERTSTNVTRALVDGLAPAGAGPIVAVIAESDETAAELTRLLAHLELESVSWPELRAGILGSAPGDGPGYAAVLAVEEDPPNTPWLFDAGLARGALGSRAVFVQLGNALIPPELGGVEVMRVDPEDEASGQALLRRLAG